MLRTASSGSEPSTITVFQWRLLRWSGSTAACAPRRASASCGSHLRLTRNGFASSWESANILPATLDTELSGEGEGLFRPREGCPRSRRPGGRAARPRGATGESTGSSRRASRRPPTAASVPARTKCRADRRRQPRRQQRSPLWREPSGKPHFHASSARAACARHAPMPPACTAPAGPPLPRLAPRLAPPRDNQRRRCRPRCHTG
jgi:hypothetical protein